jgi:hypothetical protein
MVIIFVVNGGVCILFLNMLYEFDHLYGPVVRVPGYGSGGLGSIPGTTTFSEK